MPRFHKTLLVPGERITLANETLAGRLTPSLDEDGYYIRFEQEYDNNFILEVGVRDGAEGQPRILVATLWDQADGQVVTEQATGDIDQDYMLIDGDNTYVLVIVRSAHTQLTNEAAARYNQDPNHCPACGSHDIHRGPVQVEQTGIWARVECCACEARWRNLYAFQSISMDPTDWDAPTQHVPVQPTP